MKNYFEDYRKRIDNILDTVDTDALGEVAKVMIEAFKNGKTVYVCGNGGSAATASHMQADFSFFVRYFTKFRPKVKALTDNGPIITAIGNDTSFHDVFVEQLKGNFVAGDVLILISASGNSENVVRAANYVNEKGGTSIGFVGFEGGKLKEVTKVCLYTPNPKGDYGPIEDVHMIFNHVLVNYMCHNEEFLAIPEV
ncbi:SIS domain-containing protein [Algoriphagus sp. SE2]|uniref:D-sedoheptulose-7-phosphate isomerase n=1 Tax=Algoriphagus sp. SE2 TaxID=3141536 RepID=UPI0031CDA180